MFFAFPQFLPLRGKERALVYNFGNLGAIRIGLLNLESGTRHELQPGFGLGYSPTGHLLFKQELATGNLMVLPFSLETLAAAGEAFPILNQVLDASLSLEGTLVYAGGDADGQGRQLVWRDRQGVELEAVGPRQSGLLEPDISPDGKSVAFEALENDNNDLWVLDLARGVRTRLTSEPGRQLHAAWSPSGTEVAYSQFGNEGGIFVKRADGSGDARKLFAGDAASPWWSPDGRFMIFQKRNVDTQRDLWYLTVDRVDGGGKPEVFLAGPGDETAPSFSPDGKHVVYSSDESGRWEVYVRAFPDGEGKWQLSANGGNQALWSRDGKEIFYVEGDTLMTVPVSTADGFDPGVAEPLFANPPLEQPFPHPSYAVSRDAQRFLLAEPPESGETGAIHVVENWYEEFRDRE